MEKIVLREEDLMFNRKAVRGIFVPLLLETLLSVTVGVADTMMVARAGETAVSGVSCFNTIQNLMLALFMAFGTGGAVVVGQLIGMGNKERASFASKQLVYLTLVVSIMMTGITLVIREPLLHLIYGTIEAAVFQNASSYAVPILFSLPFLASTCALNALFRSMGKTKITMEVSIVSNIINVVGNAIFILVFHWGAFGVGLATLISRIIGTLILFVRITDKALPVRINRIFHLEPDLKMMGIILHIALPSGLENSIFHIGKIVMISTIAYCGTASIAAFAVLDNIGTFANITGQASGMTLLTLGGQCNGARKFDQTRYYTRMMMKTAYLTMTALGLLIYISLPYVIRIYGFAEETYSLSLAVMKEYMIYNTFFWAASFVMPNVLKSAGDVNFTMFASILSMWIFRVFFARFLGITMGLGLRGALMGMYIDWIVRSILFFLRYKSGKWESKGLSQA